MVTTPVFLINAIWYNFVFIVSSDQLDFGSKFYAKMDRLPPETQEQLKKMSIARLTAKLGRARYDLDRLEKLESADLLKDLAGTMLAEPSAESETDLVREAREASQVPLPAEDSSSATTKGVQPSGYGSSSSRRRRLLERLRPKNSH